MLSNHRGRFVCEHSAIFNEGMIAKALTRIEVLMPFLYEVKLGSRACDTRAFQLFFRVAQKKTKIIDSQLSSAGQKAKLV
jgi:hypothetical protein